MAEEEAPALQLMIRSRGAGVEVLKGWSGNGEIPGTLEVDAQFGDMGDRTLVGVCDKWIGVNGGGKAFEVVGTRDPSRRVALGADTSDVERFAFSPLGSYATTWQRADASLFPEGSLRVWSLESGSCVKCFHAKQLKKGGINATLVWSGDEDIAAHVVANTVHVYAGDFSSQQHAIQCLDVAQVSVSPAPDPPYGLALFVPEIKGRPAAVKIAAYPGEVVCHKAFYRAQDVTLKWSPQGHGVLVQTHTDVDATGGSYYGGTGLYLLHARQTKPGEPAFECLVPLPKEGPIADAQWEPSKGREFVVIAGAIPPVAALYNLDAQPLFTFGAAHRNVVSWAPHGRFLALCGFGNMAGDVDFWDRHKKKKIGSTNVPTAVAYGWAPDSRSFMAATLAPRMNVDNAVRVYRYDGSGPVALRSDRQPLFDCAWIPASSSSYPDRPASPASKDRAKRIKDEPPPKAYVPPGARGRGSALADQIRKEREGQVANKANAASFVGSNLVPGMAPGTASRNKKRRDNQRKRKEAAEAAAELEEHRNPSQQQQQPPPDDPAPLSKDDLLKKQKGLKKKLKQVAELQAKVDSGLDPSPDQRDKLQKKPTLEADLADIDAQLARL
ncbi:hypothetical protein CTAYLR_007566 [Chrysophaeum taylorii]|uniref:Eukaryotic translation initiation factor 2A n=1 Tax=Chrysophaeum taylorii TaxID=2483200 RepID=A0AAD7XIZ8_9STRA|nr:hypothetical protein CTAYLR_007566 [Chrysophaeum taylorii]